MNARAYRQFAPFPTAVGAAFLVVGAVLVIAGQGGSLRRTWGWGLAVRAAGSVVNAILGASREQGVM